MGLTGTVEKRSDVLGRNALWKKTIRVARLPKYLCVQMMRFYWKATPDSRDHAGVKCKMLRPISFPATNFDVFEFCTPALQTFLRSKRAELGDAHGMTFGGVKKPRVGEAVGASEAVGQVSQSGTTPEVDDSDLAQALRMSLGDSSAHAEGGVGSSASGPAAVPLASAGVGLPADFRGFYDLFAIVSHKGRSADSGHYMAWVRRHADEWIVFDDDSASETTTEYVLSHLKGGGDDHMTYLLFYQAK